MFTGIIEELGRLESVKYGTDSAVVSVSARKVMEGMNVGDSVAVSGVCLTVISVRGNGFSADVMHETLKRSALPYLSAGSRVNLERALPATGRFGGHIVAGHVDGVGTVSKVKRDGNAVWFSIRADKGILRYIVEKGSVAVDGISLTVAGLDAGGFSVSVIPHTLKETTLGDKKAGDKVNIENDVIGKYIEKLASPPYGGAGADSDGGITADMLYRFGF